MPSNATLRLSLLTTLAITLTGSLAHAQPAPQPAPQHAAAPATPPATAPATKPAPAPLPPLNPEQQKIADAIKNIRADAPFSKFDPNPFNKDGTPNPNYGKPQPGFKAAHESFLKRKEAPIGVLFLGDSITAGWASLGKSVWTERYAKLEPANFGISGDKTEHVLWRIENGELDGISPKVVVLMIGTNNFGDNNKNITAGVTAIAKKINEKLPNSKLLLLAIFPRGAAATSPDGKPTPMRAKLAEINANLAKLDDGKQTFFLDIGPKFLEADGTLSKEVMYDFLHPSAKGYQIWADAMAPKLEELLK